MITKFNNFLNENESGIENLTYDEMVEISQYRREIRDYFNAAFSEYSKEVLGPRVLQGYGMSISGIERILKFSKKHKDDYLTKLVQDYLDKIEEIKFRKDANKYNL